jgi:Family of unknown function (DUF5681)
MGSCLAGGRRVMAKTERSPGDPYEVGFGKPPKRTQFRRGRSGNPYGRPRRQPDLHGELIQVLRENVTVKGQQEKVTVQQALLLRLRDEALRGELWAQKLLQKILGALPERGTEYDYIENQLEHFAAYASIKLVLEELGVDLDKLATDSEESTNDE